jgi:ABC-type branched-subunit amino acid transport system permease subunit
VNPATKAQVQRLVACLFGGFVLALMVGTQEGSQDDFGISFHKAVSFPRVIVFLLIGLVIYGLITLWPLVRPYVRRPGMAPLGIGMLVVIAAQTVLNWYDPLASAKGSGKFSAVHSALSGTSGLSAVTQPFFGWLSWTLWALAAAACLVAVILRMRPLGYVAAALGLLGAVLAYVAHRDVVNVGGGIDHSLGVYCDIVGFLIIAGAGIVAVESRTEVAETRAVVNRALNWRPGLPFAVVGVILGLLAYLTDCWFGPLTLNADFSKTRGDFSGTALSSLASQYLSWLGWVLFAAAAVLALATTYLCNRRLGWLAAAVSVAGVVITFFSVKSMTNVGASAAPQHGANWKNLGVGGYMAMMVFALFAAAAVAATSRPKLRPSTSADTASVELPVTALAGRLRRSSTNRAILIATLALALFYPPMLPVTWQNVLVVQIGVFVLLSIGLNVVVGWAGLLDLGYIAFYEIGAYATAYLVGALPRKPPHWLHAFHTPLATLPFAILLCLAAGVLLGAPTLRLRGDYLAIVTLGFGEIVQILSINNPGNLTGGPQGPTIPHPVIHIGGLHITWGQDNLPYWYLLLVMIVIVIILFYRLEGSRLGRAWAAIREDEVAAQASGVNTVRVKLLAFAIGASTSALAGTFFASQVGYFDPTLFTLQASILIVAYVVFGGMGSLPGAMAGAAVLTWLPQFLKDQVPQDDRQMWVGALVLAMMIFRPAGLLPARRRKAELEGMDEGADSAETFAVPRAGAL